MDSARWLAAAMPDLAPVAVVAEPETPGDPELVALGRAVVEAATRLLVEKRDRELATGKRWTMVLRPPRYNPHGEPEVVLSMVLELET